MTYLEFEYFVCRPLEERFYRTGTEEDRKKVLDARKKVARFWKKAGRTVPSRIKFI